jgi:cytochrome P450
MSRGAPEPVLRPTPPFKKWAAQRVMALIPFGFRVLRKLNPIFRMGSTYVVTLHDDVREVFGDDRHFAAPYWPKLRVITGDEPFFHGSGDTPEARAGRAAMVRVTGADDLPALGARAESLAEAIVARAEGEIEAVQLIRDVTFRLIGDYLGVPDPPGANIQVWGTRLFEFQFADPGDDRALRTEVDDIAPALRFHIDREIARRKSDAAGPDDVLGRCLARQAAGEPGYSDVEIRTALLCMIVGGPPQPPMVVPQALEQLLRRPDALRQAQEAARADDDARLHDIVLEAMRFDPLAPGLPRTALKDAVIARGTSRETAIPEGKTVLVGFASAMMDDRRLPDPGRFDPARRPYEYVHFGYGLHQCFGRYINHATLHRMLKPLLKRPGLERAPGKRGRLVKNGAFAESLWVRFAT